ncbi:MAG: ArsR family transcriptional regulator [Myxococcales bacterium]|nr:ArsR family transcriptional regulator [Deltaproteobacteria bacterium]NNL23466.1 ArsR family transcriptional regulator [Myxococcales bacterium]
MAKNEEELWQSEVLVSDSIGRLIEFWGFKRNMGRLWAILYLSERPLSGPEMQDRLQLSSGAVSMTLNELTRWGVVKKVWLQGERRDHYAAEGNFWKMISRVFNERERVEVLDAIDLMEDAIEFLSAKAKHPDDRDRAQFQEERIRELLDLARLGKQLLDALVKDAKVDGSPLMNVLLGGSDRR